MAKNYMSILNDIYCSLSNKMSCFVSSHINFNINFDHKLKEINSLLVNNQLDNDVNLIKLSSELSELHSLLDLKLKCTEEMNSVCSMQNQLFQNCNNDVNIINLETSPISLFVTDSLSCDSNQTKLKSRDTTLPRLKIGDAKDINVEHKNDNSCTKEKFPLYRNKTGSFLHKKLNFNTKQTKYKSKKFISFKKQNLFKNSTEFSINSKSNICLTSGGDSKYLSFTNKRKRLSLSNNFIYNRRPRNQPNKSHFWDHEDTKVYCICNKPSYGDMIACDSDKCKIEWFHYKCVDITTSPKGDWFCPMCKAETY